MNSGAAAIIMLIMAMMLTSCASAAPRVPATIQPSSSLSGVPQREPESTPQADDRLIAEAMVNFLKDGLISSVENRFIIQIRASDFSGRTFKANEGEILGCWKVMNGRVNRCAYSEQYEVFKDRLFNPRQSDELVFNYFAILSLDEAANKAILRVDEVGGVQLSEKSTWLVGLKRVDGKWQVESTTLQEVYRAY
ncbi:MAG: hypothetical protein ACFLMY_09475 [Candidatus Brachytrichaceae bacterium NZ_4S206]|jgi:hypothetical protein